LPDTRFEPFVIYEGRFLVWWGLMMFCCRLGSRRQLDFQLREAESNVLENLNALASARQESLPVNKTLDHFLSHSRSEAIAALRTRCVRQLIRGKVLDFASNRIANSTPSCVWPRASRPTSHAPRCAWPPIRSWPAGRS
jgi:hypothetical protein